MKPQDIINAATTATETMQSSIEMLRKLKDENNNLKSLLPKWRPISEVKTVESGTLILLIDLMDGVIDSYQIETVNEDSWTMSLPMYFTHFTILPTLLEK